MKILQILPALNSGGVERGTVEFAADLVRRGHQSLVMSNGGRLVAQLQAEGSQHIDFPVHRKSLSSLLQVSALRRLIIALAPDVIHLRSRVPAWMCWLAVRKLPQRPALVSTFHGLYSVSRYSEIMGCGDQVIAISDCVRDYILHNYPRINADKISVIHRGVDTREFYTDRVIDPQWRQQFYQQNPQFQNKPLLMLPGRLSRWKGQLQFVDLIAALKQQSVACHGVIIGDPTPGKDSYRQEILQRVHAAGLDGDITLLGHRQDMAELYSQAAVVLNLSQRPEPFGRTVIEALAMSVPVVAFDQGGPAESLRACLPQGLVRQNDMPMLVATVNAMLQQPPVFSLPASFTLQNQSEQTLQVYQRALASRNNSGQK